VKQRGLGQSNQKELTQKGTNIKKKSSHQERSSRRSTAKLNRVVVIWQLLSLASSTGPDQECFVFVHRSCSISTLCNQLWFKSGENGGHILGGTNSEFFL